MNEIPPVKPPLKTESRLKKVFTLFLRWASLALAMLGIGALIIIFTLSVPIQNKLDQVQKDLTLANATVSTQTSQINTLTSDNNNQQKELKSATLHLVLLKALSGVRGASLAIALDDYAGASLSLTQVSEALNNLSNLLGMDQIDVLNAMQNDAAQAISKLKPDLASAQPYLGLLEKNLVQLETQLFPNP
jgi:hypothetical protein